MMKGDGPGASAHLRACLSPLASASEEMREKIFDNVSSRAGDQIREEIELLAPMKLSEVEAIQQQIVDVARRLEDEGKLTIDAGGGDDALV